MDGTLARNNHKYRSGNPLRRRLLRRFLERVSLHMATCGPVTVLDFGCGSAQFWQALPFPQERAHIQLTGIDADARAIEQAQASGVPGTFRRTTPEECLAGGERYDLVMAVEVLEHLAQPEKTLRTLCALSSGYVLLTVPSEPWFRLGNLMCGKNVARLGNDPDHVQHWTPNGFRRLCEPYLDVLALERRSFPFTLLVGKPKKNA